VLVPLSWLAEYVDLDRDAPALADALTEAGLKVEAIHRPSAEIEGVVVAEVLAIAPHPNADKLSLVEATTGLLAHHVVCGAHNFATGDKVPLALPGARLPGGVVILPATIRGERSEGMLCSARELGLGDDHSGILILPADAELGAGVPKVLGLDEVVFEIEVTTNRPDAMSLLGVAREVSAITGNPVRLPAELAAGGLSEAGAPAGELAAVSVEDPAGCPRYLARVITGATVAPSPERVQRRLAAAGVRPISNIVDATNYALLVTGHPMHAFDLDTLSGGRIVVRRAVPGERLVTIDGATRELVADDLVIADGERPVALAGIMGGRETEVSATTTRVLLESAYFEPAAVLRSSKRHALRSEASARFERGADPNAVPFAAAYACALIQAWAGATVAPGAIDAYPEAIEPWELTVRPQRVNEVLGTDLPVRRMLELLGRLGLEPVLDSGEGEVIRVRVPTRRTDLRAEWDLVEEIARLEGLGRIPTRVPAGARVGMLSREQRRLRRVREVLVGAGFFEAYTSSLVGPADLDRMGYPPGDPAREALALVNALTVDESLLRPSLLPGLVAAAARNVARRNYCVRLFEIGRCFRRIDTGLLPEESLRLGLVMTGPTPQEWCGPARELDFYDLSGAVEVLLESLRIDFTLAPVTKEPFNPGRTATLVATGGAYGTLGELSAAAAQRYGFPASVLVAELELGRLVAIAREPERAAAPPRFPPVLLDLAVAVPERVEAAEVLEIARAFGGAALSGARVFDVYRGEQVGEGRKSLAISLTFLRTDRTLTQAEAVAARDAIATALHGRLGAQVRE
jgi:phenylalanyl-tRNA synthetase beta chain